MDDQSLLHTIAAAARGAQVRGGDPAIVDAAYDSRDVTPGALFFCVRGARLDGHDFAQDAVAAGAAAIVVDRWLSTEVPQVRVPDVRSAMGPMSAEVFGRPAEALSVVGVTGTNGKTTVTYLLESIVRAGGGVPGVVGTTGARIDGEAVPLARTTPEAPDLHRLLGRMRAAGVSVVAVEVSSHALDQERVGGIRMDVAAFTNLSQDHLDYHHSMEGYFAAKARLFEPARARMGVINADDPWGARLLQDPPIPLLSFGMDAAADVRASQIEASREGCTFRVGELQIRSSLRGAFNVTNCLCALAAARALDIPDEDALAGIASLPGVPGRMEPVDAGQEFLVVVDYAHTPDSIDIVLAAARDLASGRVIVVFGCGGDRDRAKRSLMGAAATSRADLTVVTSDNPRSEDPLAIIGEVEPGARAGGGRFVVEPDRRAAIGLALRDARPGDVVVIAGKGHEQGQEVAGQVLPFDDRTVAAEALRAIREA